MLIPNENINPIEKSFQAIFENNRINIKFMVKGNNLTVSTKVDGSILPQYYSMSISLQEIKKNKYFLQFDKMEEILDELLLKLRASSPNITRENNEIKLKISLLSYKYKDIEFILKEGNKNNDDMFKELYKIAFDLKKENSELKEEVNNLKMKINSLKVDNSQLKETINMLIEFKNKIEGEYKNKIDSSILDDDMEKIKKIKKFISINKRVKVELKYRMTKDGNSFDTFYSKSDGVSPNLLLVLDDRGNIFGGFTTVCWEKKDLAKKDLESFIFSLNKNKKFYQKHKGYETIFCHKKSGPWFWGGDIGFKNSNMSQCCCNEIGEYLDEPLTTYAPGEYFEVKEVELFKIIIE